MPAVHPVHTTFFRVQIKTHLRNHSFVMACFGFEDRNCGWNTRFACRIW